MVQVKKRAPNTLDQRFYSRHQNIWLSLSMLTEWRQHFATEWWHKNDCKVLASSPIVQVLAYSKTIYIKSWKLYQQLPVNQSSNKEHIAKKTLLILIWETGDRNHRLTSRRGLKNHQQISSKFKKLLIVQLQHNMKQASIDDNLKQALYSPTLAKSYIHIVPNVINIFTQTCPTIPFWISPHPQSNKKIFWL